jgi:hypothetical protein
MTTVEILFRYKGQPSESEIFALANAREVYGIRRLSFDRQASTLLVEYDATRLNAATVTQLVRRSGLELIEELPQIPLPELPPSPPEVSASAQATASAPSPVPNPAAAPITPKA